MSPRFALVPAADGWTLRDLAVGETYHPGLGIEAECTAWSRQPEILRHLAAAGAAPVRIWDVGLGAGGMTAACAGLLQAGGGILTSFDRDTDALDFARAHAGHFPHLSRLPQPGGPVVWNLILGDVVETLPDPARPAPHVVFFDMHSPQAQPAHWTCEFWRRLHTAWADARVLIAFHTRSTSVRSTLLLAGFFVGHGTALGDKEETTLAATRPDLLLRPLGPAWLERLRRSSSGQPRLDTGTQSGPIQEDLFRTIAAHPQFSAPPGNPST